MFNNILEKEIRKMYSGNISKAVIDMIKAIPVNHLNIVYENHTGNNHTKAYYDFLVLI